MSKTMEISILKFYRPARCPALVAAIEKYFFNSYCYIYYAPINKLCNDSMLANNETVMKESASAVDCCGRKNKASKNKIEIDG